MKTVAIVILNWNGRKMLERYLPALVRNTPQQVQIIVADNASTDDSMAFLATHYPDIRCIELYQNLGFAEGYNRALQQVESEYYVLLNSDVEVTENWLQPLLDYMEH
ncbi:glycosyltransferase, partial [Segatella oulorum]|uniref:glycosyltransferase family 2 protein n=1 Tax=Segatella oulorum TaxID=28136 RepID=UPI0028E4CCEF